MSMHHRLIGSVVIEFDTKKMTQDEFTELGKHLHDNNFYSPDDASFYYDDSDSDFEFESNQDSFDWSLEDDYIRKAKDKFLEIYSEMLEEIKEKFGEFNIEYRIFDIIC